MITYLNYKGDKRGATFPNGPARFVDGVAVEALYPVDAEYDPATSMTRVGFSPVVPS